MQAFETSELFQLNRQTGDAWLEFLRVPALSMGMYVLAAGSVDSQAPHSEDEIYYVVRGNGQIQVADEHQSVRAGSIVYVAANVTHRFHSISEELAVLVFFAPAEYSQAVQP